MTAAALHAHSYALIGSTNSVALHAHYPVALHAHYPVALSTASVSDRLLVDSRPLSDAEVHSLTVVVLITASPSRSDLWHALLERTKASAVDAAITV